MKNKYIILIPLFLWACGAKDKDRNIIANDTIAIEKLTKLQQLMLLPTDSVLEHYDLSNDSLKEFPNLSEYTIRSLDLSYNQLDTLITNCLPQKVEKLNLSHNIYQDFLRIYKNTIKTLKEIDVSYNRLDAICISEPLYRIIISHNDITHVDFNHENLCYLDISFNPHLSNHLQITPNRIDTIQREGIANKKPLHTRFRFFSSAEAYERVMAEEAKEPDVESMTMINKTKKKKAKK